MSRCEGAPADSWASQKCRFSRRLWLRGSLLTATAYAALLASPTPAQAKNAGPAAASNAPANDEQEIIVTARKREESALKVPVIETVLTQQKIEQASIVDIKDIASFAPGMVVGDSVLSVGTQVSIRGIGTVTLDPGVDQSIAMVIDGFSFTQGLPFRSGTFDLAQIEVLKGPQALFFGKSSQPA
jgi:iron complex outermembrane recepter protein